MFVLQLNPLYNAATGRPEALVAVARSEDIDVLSAFVQSNLSLAEDGVTIKHYESTTQLPDGTGDTLSYVPCLKMFKLGSPLEQYSAPADQEMLIVDLGSMEQRIADLTAELVSRVTSDWGQILAHVANIQTIEAASSLTALDL